MNAVQQAVVSKQVDVYHVPKTNKALMEFAIRAEPVKSAPATNVYNVLPAKVLTMILNHAFPVNLVSLVDKVFAKNVHQER